MIHSRLLPSSLIPDPIRPWTLVASTTSSRRSRRASPTISSERPSPYTSAVSTKLTPASRAWWIIRTHSSWSVFPQGPNIMAPRQWVLTFTPVRPSVRYSMASALLQVLLPHQHVSVRILELHELPPMLLFDRAEELHAPAAQFVVVGLDVLGQQDQALQRAGDHGFEPGHERDRSLAARRADFHPAISRSHVLFGDQLQPECLRVEGLGAPLVAHRDRDQPHMSEVHRTYLRKAGGFAERWLATMAITYPTMSSSPVARCSCTLVPILGMS